MSPSDTVDPLQKGLNSLDLSDAKITLSHASTTHVCLNVAQTLSTGNAERLVEPPRDRMATCPFDVLALIFEAACATFIRDSKKLDVDWNAMVAPYSLSRVCKHWRNVTMDTPSIWQYIGVPRSALDVGDFAPFVEHVDRLIARSGTGCLDLVIRYTLLDERNASASEDAQIRHNLHFSMLFTKLLPIASRLRTFHVVRNGGLTFDGADSIRDLIVDILCCPTPRLQVLFVDLPTWSNEPKELWLNFPREELPLFLPDAPALQRVHIADVPIVWLDPHPDLGRLTSLSLKQELMYTHMLWDMLYFAPNLLHLSLDFGDVKELRSHPAYPVETLPVTTLVLSRRGSFPLFDAAWQQIALPNLTTIDMESWVLSSMVVTESLAKTVTSIKLEFCYDEDDGRRETFAKLRQLQSIRSAALHYDETLDIDERLLFDSLCSYNGPMWPRLRDFQLTGLRSQRSREQDGMYDLIRMRNMRNSFEYRMFSPVDVEPDIVPDPIKSLKYDTVSVPPKVSARIMKVIGRENCTIIECGLLGPESE